MTAINWTPVVIMTACTLAGLLGSYTKIVQLCRIHKEEPDLVRLTASIILTFVIGVIATAIVVVTLSAVPYCKHLPASLGMEILGICSVISSFYFTAPCYKAFCWLHSKPK